MERKSYFVTPAKAGIQALNIFLNSSLRPGPRLSPGRRFVAFAGMTVLAINSSAWSMAGQPNPDPNAPPAPEWAKWFPIVVMVAVFYFLIIRPQSSQRKQRNNMINNLKKGDRIVTQGGLIATVVNVTGDTVDVKLNEETKVKLKKSGVAEVLSNDGAIETVGAGK